MQSSETYSSATESLLANYWSVRNFTKQICEPLQTEDYVIQSMPDVSPTRWHLAHTTWFFESFVLKPYGRDYSPIHPAFEYLFNSYYNAVGEQFPRSQRGLLSRPTVSEVWDYRGAVDDAILKLVQDCCSTEITEVIGLGLQHEQQHQELMLTDVKHVLSCNPMLPAYSDRPTDDSSLSSAAKWHAFDGGISHVGHDGDGFCFDNERPNHECLLQPYQIQSRLVTNAEYLEFIEDGGYQRPELWLSMGWTEVQRQGWTAPLYWHLRDGSWREFSLQGLRPMSFEGPVCHVSYFEADAFARWRGCRLPTEFEWENAAHEADGHANFADTQRFHPLAAQDNAGGLQQMLGDAWEWTSSQYTAYPGYRPLPGALGEYNGKFMCNQFVLKGGSCATSRSHIRRTYRNFFPPEARWQFSGIRLAQ